MQVQQPPLELAAGYDILIWVGEEGEILTQAYSLMGDVVLHSMFDDYSSGDTLEILVSPEDFSEDIPPTARVGYVDPTTNKVHTMRKIGLH